MYIIHKLILIPHNRLRPHPSILAKYFYFYLRYFLILLKIRLKQKTVTFVWKTWEIPTK